MSDDNKFSLGDILWEYADYTPPERPASPPPTVPKSTPPAAPQKPVIPSPQPVTPPQRPAAQPGQTAPYLPANHPPGRSQTVAPPSQQPATQPVQPSQPSQSVPPSPASQPGQAAQPQPSPAARPGQAAQPQPGPAAQPGQAATQPQTSQPAAPSQAAQAQPGGQPGQPKQTSQPQPGQTPPNPQGLSDDGPDLIAFTPDPKAKQTAQGGQPQQPAQPGTTGSEGDKVVSFPNGQVGGQPSSSPTPPGGRPAAPGTPETAARAGRERKPRPDPETPPDTSPAQLAEEYAHGLPTLGARCVASGLLSVLLLVLSLLDSGVLPILDGLLPGDLLLPVGLGMFALCIFFCLDVLEAGVVQITRKAPNGDTLALFATVFTAVDGITLLVSQLRPETLPFFGPCGLMLTFHLIGQYCTRAARYQACTTAATVAQPYIVTQDTNVLAGQNAFRKWIGSPRGFGSQIQTEYEGELRFRRLTPVLLTACFCLSMITTVAHHQPWLAFWSLSALFIASATLGVSLTLGLPLRMLGKRLAKLGVAIAGWPGVLAGRGCKAAMLHDYDIYPPGTISLASGKVFGSYSMERTISFAASVIRASGSGLTYLFDKILRAEGGAYLAVEKLTMQENGLIGQTQGQQVLVGNSDFMSRMGVALPPGIRAKDAVFCAVGREAIGMFALKYSMHASILPSLRALFAHGLHPILVTRDFNLNPHRLRLRGRLPVDQITFPDLQRRVILSGPNQVHNTTIVAVLCREGLSAFSHAVICTKRLRRAAKVSSLLVNISACVGVFLTATLSSAGALGAMCAWNLSLFLLLWLVPVLLLSLWVAEY